MHLEKEKHYREIDPQKFLDSLLRNIEGYGTYFGDFIQLRRRLPFHSPILFGQTQRYQLVAVPEGALTRFRYPKKTKVANILYTIDPKQAQDELYIEILNDIILSRQDNRRRLSAQTLIHTPQGLRTSLERPQIAYEQDSYRFL